eukprot:291523_1
MSQRHKVNERSRSRERGRPLYVSKRSRSRSRSRERDRHPKIRPYSDYSSSDECDENRNNCNDNKESNNEWIKAGILDMESPEGVMTIVTKNDIGNMIIVPYPGGYRSGVWMGGVVMYAWYHELRKFVYQTECIQYGWEPKKYSYDAIYNKQDNCLYVYHMLSDQLLVINISTGKSKQYDTGLGKYHEDQEEEEDEEEEDYEKGIRQLKLLVIEGILHLIKLNDWEFAHYILNDKHEFNEASCIPVRFCVHFDAVYVKKKGMFVLIIKNSIWIFDLKSKKWKKMFTGIRIKWRYLNIVLTADDRNIIIAGSTNDASIKDDIFFLEFVEHENKTILRKSNIVTPKGGPQHRIANFSNLDFDETVVSSFVKQCFKQKEFKNMMLPPKYIFQLILKWYHIEKILWLEWGKCDKDKWCCMIPVNTILSSIDYNFKSISNVFQ